LYQNNSEGPKESIILAYVFKHACEFLKSQQDVKPSCRIYQPIEISPFQRNKTIWTQNEDQFRKNKCMRTGLNFK